MVSNLKREIDLSHHSRKTTMKFFWCNYQRESVDLYNSGYTYKNINLNTNENI